MSHAINTTRGSLILGCIGGQAAEIHILHIYIKGESLACSRGAKEMERKSNGNSHIIQLLGSGVNGPIGPNRRFD